MEGPLGNHYDYGTAIRPSYKKSFIDKIHRWYEEYRNDKHYKWLSEI